MGKQDKKELKGAKKIVEEEPEEIEEGEEEFDGFEEGDEEFGDLEGGEEMEEGLEGLEEGDEEMGEEGAEFGEGDEEMEDFGEDGFPEDGRPGMIPTAPMPDSTVGSNHSDRNDQC